jgi:hypothetical protein
LRKYQHRDSIPIMRKLLTAAFFLIAASCMRPAYAQAAAPSVTLTWNAGTGGGTVTSFQVQEATVSGGPYTTIGTVAFVTGQTSYSYTWTGGVGGTVYYFVQEAIGPGGTSAPSPQSTATFPVAPPAAPSIATIVVTP